MGAENIDFKMKGRATKREIEAAFKRRQELDAEENGHQSGYSGDFQTINEIKFELLNSGTGDYSGDYQTALEKSEKWDYGQAIYTKNSRGEEITLIVAWGAC